MGIKNTNIGLLTLAFAEFVERFSYWGFLSVLTLYLINQLHFADGKAYQVYGAFTAATFGLSIIGGRCADKLLGFKKAVLIGLIFVVAGNLLLISNFLYLGISFLACGTGFSLPNNANLLGTFYQKGDIRKDRVFTLFYMGTNLGGLLGPIVYGFVSVSYGWHKCFLISIICVVIWLITFFKLRVYFSSYGNLSKKIQISKAYGLSVIYFLPALFLLLIGIVYCLMKYENFTGGLLTVVGLCTFSYILKVAFQSNSVDRKNIFLLILMMLFALIFFINVFQLYSSLILYIEKYVRRDLIIFTIPASAFASLEPLFVILCAPLLAYIWTLLGKWGKEPFSFSKITLGLFLEGLAFGVFAISTFYAQKNNSIALMLIIIGNLLLGVGELCIMPIVISAITRLAPASLKGMFMGALYLSLAASGYLSGVVAIFTTHHSSNIANTLNSSIFNYFHVYVSISCLVVALAFVLFILTIAFKRLFTVNTSNNKL